MIRMCIYKKEQINVLVQSHFNQKKKRKGQQDNKSLFSGEV
jgi:hypothetical protein